ncbi:hypothetical protein [Hydrogenispora ethanolica]|jgi:hypothetical protein|uniref:hypothetical protein n=1 Tax=Hydrogenispora ethanolica TaxID=1082276 RepID=UPI001404AA65|nr:hypothetical protein [Hydrogenispora ethanolica]
MVTIGGYLSGNGLADLDRRYFRVIGVRLSTECSILTTKYTPAIAAGEDSVTK